MTELDQADLDAQVAKFNAGIAGKAELIKRTGPEVLKQESRRLMSTLINISPPKNRQETFKHIERDVDKTFQTLRNSQNPSQATERAHLHSGSQDMKWYAWSPHALFGVKGQLDMTGSSDEEVYQKYVHTKLNAKGRQILGKRGKQTVYLWQKVLVAEKSIAALKRRLKKHVGRLKAGWLHGWTAAGGPESGKGAPPKWVMDHKDGARGGADPTRLGDPNYPQFVVWNNAKGVGSRFVHGRLMQALKMRVEAMAKRTAYLLKYPDRIKEDVAE